MTRPAPSDAELNARVAARLAQRVYPHRVMGHVQHRALTALRRQSLTPSELMRAVCVAEQAQIVKCIAGLAFNGAIARDGERWRCVARGAGR